MKKDLVEYYRPQVHRLIQFLDCSLAIINEGGYHTEAQTRRREQAFLKADKYCKILKELNGWCDDEEYVSIQ